MAEFAISTATLEQVRKELHNKSNRLETIISGLESSVQSPHHRLINMAVESFGEQGDKLPKVDLGELRQSELERLAVMASRKKRGRPRGSRSRAAAA